MPINIHGKQYMTVAERLVEAKDDLQSVSTEVLQHTPVVVVKASIMTKKGPFTGISSANPAKAIEKTNPYEVAETSAVGRALAFAGYGAIESIASAEEVTKSIREGEETPPWEREWKSEKVGNDEEVTREKTNEHCEHTFFWINEVKKDGPNKGKKFKSCKECREFLGWYQPPEGQMYEEEIN